MTFWGSHGQGSKFKPPRPFGGPEARFGGSGREEEAGGGAGEEVEAGGAGTCPGQEAGHDGLEDGVS